MKIAKRAEQKNFIVNFECYNGNEQDKLITSGKLFKIDENDSWRISTSELKEVKVVLDEYGYYETVGVTHNGDIIHVII